MRKNTSILAIARKKLNDLLEHKHFPAGTKLPSERELEELLNIKRMTLRQALLYLEAESRIFRKDRKGWFVCLPRFNYYPTSTISFYEAALAQGRYPSWGYTTKEKVIDYPAVAEILLLSSKQDALYCITSWGALDGHKVWYRQSFINPQVAPGFIELLDKHSFYAHWEKQYREKLSLHTLSLKPTRLSEELGKEIGGTAGIPAILLEKYHTDINGRVLQVDMEYWRFDAVNIII
jgi:DNA-binding GntR family transcriptional regulator